jgi:hypothetical protein
VKSEILGSVVASRVPLLFVIHFVCFVRRAALLLVRLSGGIEEYHPFGIEERQESWGENQLGSHTGARGIELSTTVGGVKIELQLHFDEHPPGLNDAYPFRPDWI